MSKPRKSKRGRAVSIRSKRELVRRLAPELRRSRVPERTIGAAMDGVSIILNEVEVVPRDFAEQVLNQGGLSTYWWPRP